MSKATKDRIVRLKIREMFLEMKWVTTGVSISLTTQTNNIQFVCHKRSHMSSYEIFVEHYFRVQG